MDIRNWCNSDKLGYCYDDDDTTPINSPRSSSPASANKLKLKVLWMKLKKEKRKIFESPSPPPNYDSYTYQQNFDQGFAWDEPDNVSRSFSVRFADPKYSSIFLTSKSAAA